MTSIRPLILFDLKNHRIRIHKNTLRALRCPNYIVLLVNPRQRMIALLKSDRSNPRAHFIPWAALTEKKSFELHSTSLLDNLKLLSNWDENQAYRIYGSIDETSTVVHFRIDDSFKYGRVSEHKRGE